MITREEFIAVEGNIKEHYESYLSKVDTYIEAFYNVETDETAQQTNMTTGAMGLMTTWAGTVAYDQFKMGYTDQIRPTKFSTGIQIEREWIEDKEYKRIKDHVSKVRYGVLKTLRYYSVLPFENAFNTALYTGPDAAALCSAAHRNVPGDTAQSNTNTLELNYDNLETSQLAMYDFTDDRGHKMCIEGNLVIAGPKLRKTCMQLFGTDKEAYVADNQKNYYKDMAYKIHPLITGEKWFLASKELMEQGDGLNFWNRRDPKLIERDGDAAKGDFNTEVLSWKAVGRWIQYWVNWWFIYGNNPA